ncbi:hypothetical protein [Bdellovibrio sp. HCB209]|uniref:hypothetical protein n=1 Tax=Bdellovibrio sp. HCB209 TaxID=3394354 RepID=UPI0039B376E5
MKSVLLSFMFLVTTVAAHAESFQYVTAGLEALAKNSQSIRSELGLYVPTDADLSRFMHPDEIREFRENTMGLTMEKSVQYVIATIEGREVLLRSSSVQRDGVFNLKASGGLEYVYNAPGNEFLRELQQERSGDILKLELTVRADGTFEYKASLQNMWDGKDTPVGDMYRVREQSLINKSGSMKFVNSSKAMSCSKVF